MSKELTVAEYMELVGGEGLLIKSLAGHVMTSDATGSEPEDDEEENEDEDELDEADAGPVGDDDDEEEEEDDDTTFELTICTSDIDRIMDVLNPMGMETKNFQHNPLFLYEHGLSEKGPMTNPDNVLGRINSVTLREDKVTALAQYIPREGNQVVNKVLDMERKGLIPGNSMGWVPLSGIKLHEDGRRTIERWELLEVSKVLVPVNGRTRSHKYSNERAPNARTSD